MDNSQDLVVVLSLATPEQNIGLLKKRVDLVALIWVSFSEFF